MIARITTVSFSGVDAFSVDVQVQMSNGLPAFSIVGLPDKAVAESRERVRAALYAMGLSLPPKRIVVNLSPADIVKEGSHYDLPIALGLLVAMGVLPTDELSSYLAMGELGLDGRLAPVSGVLPAALHAASSHLGMICPEPSGGEAAWAQDISILAPRDLISLINHFKGAQVLKAPQARLEEEASFERRDLMDIKGQETAKRALEIAAAGGHNLLLVGPPGAGKSMLAARLPGLLPPLDAQEALEITMIHSVGGLLKEGKLLRHRPYRDPHHSASTPALVGGGGRALPGEASLAHRGVLFLDELPEFSRTSLEALRQPLETGRITVSRANAHTTYPAAFQLIAAMNPCRCGHLDDASRACSRVPKCALDYQSRISGPLMDRIDLTVYVPALTANELISAPRGESSALVAERVHAARYVQKQRYSHDPYVKNNAQVQGQLLDTIAPLGSEGAKLMQQATDRHKLSARGYHRILKVARTIADLQGHKQISPPHLAEAIHYRQGFTPWESQAA
jgi:magnesium chelatase family protein